MVQFKSWKDANLFLKEYASASCMNCKYGPNELDKGQFVCMKTLSPIRLDMVRVCVEWENDGKTFDDLKNHNAFNLSEKLIDEIEKLDGFVTFEMIKDLVSENE